MPLQTLTDRFQRNPVDIIRREFEIIRDHYLVDFRQQAAAFKTQSPSFQLEGLHSSSRDESVGYQMHRIKLKNALPDAQSTYRRDLIMQLTD